MQHNATQYDTAVRRRIRMFGKNLQNMLACWLDVLRLSWLTVEDRLSILQQLGTNDVETVH